MDSCSFLCSFNFVFFSAKGHLYRVLLNVWDFVELWWEWLQWHGVCVMTEIYHYLVCERHEWVRFLMPDMTGITGMCEVFPWIPERGDRQLFNISYTRFHSCKYLYYWELLLYYSWDTLWQSGTKGKKKAHWRCHFPNSRAERTILQWTVLKEIKPQ